MFTFIKEQKELVGMLSTLRLGGFPKGINLSSSHTGKLVKFGLVNTDEVNNEPDMVAYYAPLEDVPNVKKLTIFND